jgi:hypothetical protein
VGLKRANYYLGLYTWATLLTVTAAPVGAWARVTDFGVAEGLRFVWDGTRWTPDGVQMLARSSAAVNAPADTNEDILATINIPANMLGINAGVRLRFDTSYTNNVDTKTVRCRLGGIGGTQLLSNGGASVNGVVAELVTSNNGAANAQTNTGTINGALNSSTASTVDTTAATTLVITMQKQVAGDTATLRRYTCEIYP